MTEKRSKEFQRNSLLENALLEISSLLEPAEAIAEAKLSEPEQPVLFVIGAPRSGTTLSMQVLASSGVFGYPSNLISRFYAAPYIGSLVQRLTTDPEYDYKNEMSGSLGQNMNFFSEIGKTRGALQPSEFWYFWRRFIPNEQPRFIRPEEESKIDIVGFRKGVAALERGLQKPFATKGMILQYNLNLLYRIFTKALFLFVHRETISNIGSLLNARERHTGDRNTWFSVQPPGWERLKSMSAERQVTGQVLLTNEHIEKSLKAIPQTNQFIYSYEYLCANPERWLEQVFEKIFQLGANIGKPNLPPQPFKVTNKTSEDLPRHDEIRDAISWFNSEFIHVNSMNSIQ